MIHSIEIENFKAFGQRVRIPLAPITLIFGQNSAGKSSILHGLNLLKQTRESREAGALLLPRTEKGIVDLGSFQELLFNHDLKNVLTFKIESSTAFNRSSRFWPSPLKRTALELSFSRPSLEGEVQLNGINVFLMDPNDCLAKFSPSNRSRDLWRGPIFYGSRERRFGRLRLRALECSWVSKATHIWEPFYKTSLDTRQEILQGLRNEWNRLSQKKDLIKQNPLLSEDDESEEVVDDQTFEDLRSSISFYSQEFTLEAFINRRTAREIGSLIGTDGFIPVTVGRGSKVPFPEDAILAQRQSTLDVSEVAVYAARALENALDTLFPLGPFRRPPERWYIFTGTSPQDVGYEGDLLPDLLFRRPELVEETNRWLENLGVGYAIKVRSVGQELKDLFEVRLVDKRKGRDVEVSLTDVGFGVSQLLPFIVQSLAAKDQIISIEQPEVHIHPRLQADLGDLLASAIRPPRNNQFIIETHSEHLILRILRRIRESQESSDVGALKAEDVSVLYVVGGKHGARVEQLPITVEGDFSREWPEGFFGERAKELF